ncbi:MAG TPA: O-antigen ligase family protein [Pyrinomonadaceae bacterium]|jgi:O-antigen ligase
MERNATQNQRSQWFEEALIERTPSRLTGLIFFLICAIPVFSGVAYGGVDAWALGLLTFVCGAITIFWIIEAFIAKEFRFNSSFLQLPLLGLIVIGLIQLLPLRSRDFSDLIAFPAVNSLSLDPYSTRFFIIQLLVYLVFFAAALTFINNQKRLQKIVLTVIIFGAVMAFFGILQRLANPDAIYGLRPTPQAIPFASFVNQHHFAAFMNMTLGLTLGLLFGKGVKKDKNMLLIIAALIMGIALILTSSRGGILSFFAVIGFIVIPRLLKKDESSALGGNKSKFALLAGVLALLGGLFGAVLMLGGDQSLLRGVGLTSTEDVSSGRTHFWSVALKIFLDHPILGAGLNAFGVAFTKYDTWSGTFRVEQAHNEYLQILADAGIVGCACVAAFIYLLFKNSLSAIEATESAYRKAAARGALAGCLGILIHSFFDFPLRTPANAFFFLILVVIATIFIPNWKTERKKS